MDWSEWNGRFRDTVRRFGKGDAGQLADLGWRLTGSADLYGDDGRSAYNSINFVTCHDGFTLHDLVSYNGKHNERERREQPDGTNDNNSWNCGVEGDTDDPAVLALRRQLMKNHACHLLFSSGTPMMLGGDEFARTQRGNNNAYCQDNEISWFDWDAASRERSDLVEFFRKAIALHAPLPGPAAAEVPPRQGSRRRRRARPDLVRAGSGRRRAGTTRARARSATSSTAREDGARARTPSGCSSSSTATSSRSG